MSRRDRPKMIGTIQRVAEGLTQLFATSIACVKLSFHSMSSGNGGVGKDETHSHRRGRANRIFSPWRGPHHARPEYVLPRPPGRLLACCGSRVRTRMNDISLNFPPNFEGLVLGCIDADF